MTQSSNRRRYSSSGKQNSNRNRRGRNNFNRSQAPQGTRRDQSSRNRRKGSMEMKPDFELFVKKAKPVTEEVYKPENTFAELGLHTHLVTTLENKKFTDPTPIQDQAIPHLLESRDLIGIANTGTGKTAAFLLPLIHQALENNNKRVLVLAPTRELAMQIDDEIKEFTRNTSLRSTIVVGGMPIYRQIENLRKTRHFIVGTTGRTLDLISQGKIKLKDFDTVVLDEMDQMLDMGFLPDIKKIMAGVRQDKHLLFFSATLDNKIEKVALDLLTDPVHVSVKKTTTTDNVEQNVIMWGSGQDRFEMLHDRLLDESVTRAIVFENTKHGVKNMERKLLQRGLKVVAIHGNKNQNQRKRALDDFKKGRANIMLATNVAARGLDIPNVSHVFNYSLPQSREDYIHRIGRTGRAGKMGHAFTFVPK